jgi:hypothetical protein
MQLWHRTMSGPATADWTAVCSLLMVQLMCPQIWQTCRVWVLQHSERDHKCLVRDHELLMFCAMCAAAAVEQHKGQTWHSKQPRDHNKGGPL